MASSVIPTVNESGETIHYEFDEQFQNGLASLALRDTAFMRRCSHLLYPSHFESIGNAGAVQIALRHFKRYGCAIDPLSLRMAVADAIKEKVISGSEKAEVVKTIQHAFNEPLPSSAPFEERLATFAREQAVSSALLASVEKLGKQDFTGIENDMRKALDVGVNEDGDAYDYYKEIEARTAERRDKIAGVKPPRGITTGFVQFDDLLYHRGWGRKEMSVLMAGAKQGKCVKTNTLIFTEDGLMEIGNYIPESLDDDEYQEHVMMVLGRNGMEKTSHVYNSGLTYTKRIKTHFGYGIEGTHCHPMLVLDKSGDLVWKRLDEVQVGDYMAVQRGAGVYGNKTDLSAYQTRAVRYFELSNRKSAINFPKLPSVMTEDLAEWLGMVVAEGHIGKNIQFTQKDSKIVERFVELTQKLFGVKAVVKPSHSSSEISECVIHSVMLIKYLNAFGVSANRSADCVVPLVIRQAPRECVLRFVGAVLGLEGNIRQESDNKFTYDLTMASKMLIDQIAMFLLNEGIVCRRSIKESMATNGLRIKRTYYRLTINNSNTLIRLCETFGLYEDRKNEVLNKVSAQTRTAQNSLPVNDLIMSLIEEIRSNNLSPFAMFGEDSWQKIKDCVWRIGRRPTYVHANILLNGFEKIGYNSANVQKLRDLVRLNYYYDQVVNIKDDMAITVDLTVPETHSFFANGLIAHNTLAMVNFAANASKAGFNVLYCTLEVSARIISERLDAYVADTAVRDLENEIIAVRNKVESRSKTSGRLIIHEFASGSMSPRMLRTLIEKYRNRGVIFDLVVVDYADIMAPDYRTDNVIENSKEIYVGLRALAFEFDCAILTATQTNREGYKAQTAKAEHVAEDFNKIRTADLVISINATEEERQNGVARLYFAASRNQESGFTIRVKQDIRKMQFISGILGVE